MSERIETQVSQIVEVIDREHPEITIAELEAMRGPELVVVEPVGRTHRPLLVAAAIVVLLASAGGIWLLLRDDGDDPADQPVITEPEPSVVAPEPAEEEGLEWTLVEGGAGPLPPSASWSNPLVSNGSSFLYQEVTAGTPSGLWRSVDGLIWEEVDHPEADFGGLLAAGDEYLMDAQAFPNDCEERCPVWRSSDGLDWSLAESAATAASGTATKVLFGDFVWRVDSAETVLRTDAPNLDWGTGLSQVVIEFRDRLVLFGFDPSGRFRALESTDGTTWTPIESAPPFALTHTSSQPPYRFDAFSCGYAASDSWGAVLLPDGSGHGLWTSTDGVSWTETRLDLTPLDLSDEFSAISSYCIRAFEGGWVIVPNYPATPDAVLFSRDGLEWAPLELPEEHGDFRGVPVVAGDTIFIVEDATTPHILVGTLAES